MTIYKHIRTWDGSQNRAFEELVTQFALTSKPNDSTFFALHGKGGDGGVDCYCILPNGEEWGWQAKFVPNLSSSFKQIDSSVKAALKNHPKLKKYYICLPVNRTPPKNKTQKSEIDKWNEKKEEWELLAHNFGMSVSFEYIGESDLIAFLQKDENKGINYFWFNNLVFTPAWFENHISEMKNIAGSRYTPELNVELDIVKVFDAFGRTNEFYLHLRRFDKKIKETLERLQWSISRFILTDELLNKFKAVKDEASLLFGYLRIINKHELTDIDFNSIQTKSNFCYEEIIQIGETITEETVVKEKDKNINENSNFHYYNDKLSNVFYELAKFCESNEAKAANSQCIFLEGKWGTGKTHLFCDLVETRNENDYKSVIAFGQHLTGTTGFPFDFLKKSFDLNVSTFDELLNALDSMGKTFDGRVIIFIDALNEGKGKEYWISHLTNLASKISRYKNVALAVSCRSPYEESVKPIDLKCITLKHEGYQSKTFEAITNYFDFYKIQFPTFIVLDPEFSNPMFLKILCEGLRKRDIKQLPNGISGVHTIFELYISAVSDNINRKLNLLSKLDYTNKAINTIVVEMLNTNQEHISFERAFEIIEVLKPSTVENQSLFYELIAEGIIVEVKDYEGNNVIRFGYERFFDFLKASYLLKEVEPHAIKNKFEENGKLFFLNEDYLYKQNGVIESLSIIFPEKYGIELFECITVKEHNLERNYYRPFLQSLVWRDKSKTTTKTVEFFIKIINYNFNHEEALETLLTIATIPNHTLNIFWLHNNLMKWDLPTRDHDWSMFIHKQYGNESAVDRTLNWCERISDPTPYDKQSLYCTGVFLSWLLTNSNREIRDRATKAIVHVLHKSPDLMLDLLKLFEECNDPYVTERLYCAAFGCTLLSSEKLQIKKLSDYIFEKIFKDRKPPAHVLIRDYAKRIIEYSVVLGNMYTKKQLTCIQPPYISEPVNDIPEEEIWEKYNYKNGYKTLLFSLGEIGDFYLYVLGGNNNKSFLHRDFKIKDARKWIFQKVIDMGWSPEKFEQVEDVYFYNRADRHEHRKERIGKKYQWIAYYELVARVLDNCKITDKWGEGKYIGPWQYFIRNIDPSNINFGIHEDKKIKYSWEPLYNFPQKIDSEWVKSKTDIPPISSLLIVKNQLNNNFYNFEADWRAEHAEEYEFNENMINLAIYARAFFVSNDSVSKLVKFYNNRIDFDNEPIESDAFMGEHFWSDSIERNYDIIEDEEYNINKIPEKLIRTTARYKDNFSYDHADNYINRAYIPSYWFAKHANLHWNKKDFSFQDSSNNLVCYDPATLKTKNFKVFESDRAFLVEENFIKRFLKENNLTLFWHIYGEKIYFDTRKSEHPYGKLYIFGSYYLKNDKFAGSIKTKYNIY